MAFKAPAQIAESFNGVGKAKGSLPIMKMIILGILAGAYIGFGAELSTMVLTGPGATLGLGMSKLFGGAVFSVGLMLVVIGGAELFTGNNLMTIGVANGDVKFLALLKNWGVVYLANLIGSVLLVYIMYKSNLWQTGAKMVDGVCSVDGGGCANTALGIAIGKVNLSWSEAFYRGIGCNWLVCLAVWLAASSEEISGKIWGIFFPIMAFVASGFEHCVANMYFIPMGIFLKADPVMVDQVASFGAKADALTWGGFAVNNLVPVTLGNIVGGAVFVGLAYYFAYVRKGKNA